MPESRLADQTRVWRDLRPSGRSGHQKCGSGPCQPLAELGMLRWLHGLRGRRSALPRPRSRPPEPSPGADGRTGLPAGPSAGGGTAAPIGLRGRLAPALPRAPNCRRLNPAMAAGGEEAAALPEEWRLYLVPTRAATFRNWPFTDGCACTPERVSPGWGTGPRGAGPGGARSALTGPRAIHLPTDGGGRFRALSHRKRPRRGAVLLLLQGAGGLGA